MINQSSTRYWITWEDHRRSRSLSNELGSEYVLIRSGLGRPWKYLTLLFRTCVFLIRNRKSIRGEPLFCQNPSVVLAAMLCFFKPIYRYALIVDRHTNFKFGTEKSVSLKWKFFHFLSRYSLRKADLTIVTNQPLAEYIVGLGAKAFVLPDPVPKFPRDLRRWRANEDARYEKTYLFVCTFSQDEPVLEVLDCFKDYHPNCKLYVSGDCNKFDRYAVYRNIENICFTGFLNQEEYDALVNHVDALIVLTNQEYTLNCGSYEALGAEKPQIVYGSDVIKSYFDKGCLYLNEFNAKSLSELVSIMNSSYDSIKSVVCESRKEKISKFEEKITSLEAAIRKIACDSINSGGQDG